MARYFASLFGGLIILFLFGVSDTLAATYTVTKTADTDDGTCNADCSLKEAVAAANLNVGADTIEFNIPESDGGYIAPSGTTQGYFLITTTSTVTLSDDSGVYINGYSQSGSSRNTASFGQPINTVLKIQVFINLTGTNLSITGNNNHITGINLRTLNANLASIVLDSSSNNWIEGNFIGADISGSVASNAGLFRLANNSGSNTFGTNGDGVGDPGERNLFSGSHISNAIGGYISLDSGDSNIVAGNYLGTDKTGRICTNKVMNYNPLQISTSNNYIGTDYDGISDTEEPNIIGCTTNNSNARAYVRILSLASSNFVQGNYIGVSPYGDRIGDLTGTGLGAIQVSALTGNVIKGNVLGNAGQGIRVLASTVLYNTFRENIISDVWVIPISLNSNTTPLVNDPGDIDTGANDLMNYPTINSADFLGGKSFRISGNLDGNPSEAPYTIEVCRSSNHSSGNGGCLESLGTMTLSAPGDWEMNVYVPGYTESSRIYFTSLATNANGSTGEFGNNYEWSEAAPIESAPSYVFGAAPTTVITLVSEVTSMASSTVFNYDAYLSVAETPKASVYNLPKTNYWQVGPRKEVWWRSDFNDAKILASEVNKPFTLILKYNESDLGSNLPEKNLRLAYSKDDGKTWKIFTNYVLDTKNNSIAIVTKEGGLFMFVSGYPTTKKLPNVQSASTSSSNESLSSPSTPNPSPTTKIPDGKKRCIWFICW